VETLAAAVEPVLIISPSGTFRGGADGSLLHLLRRHQQFPRPIIVVFLENGSLVDEVRSLGIPVHLFAAGRLRDASKFLFTSIRIAQLIAKESPTVVLSWQTKAHLYASCAGSLARTRAKLIYFQKNNPDSSMLSRLIRSLPTTGALACSEFVAARERARTHFPVIAVHSASELIDLSPTEIASLAAEGAALRSTLPLPVDCKIAVMVGRLQRWKGFDAFVQAIATLREENQNIAGLIIGGRDLHESGYEQDLRNSIQGLGLSKVIHLAGAQANVAPWLLAADLFVHASLEEPFGQVIVEAMSLGVPVVACRPGGPDEIVSDGTNGLLFTHGNQEELVNAIRTLLLDAELAIRFRDEAQRSVVRFAPHRFVTQLAGALDSF